MLKKLLYVTQLDNRGLAWLAFLMCVGSFLEVLGIGLVAPFSAIVFAPELEMTIPGLGNLDEINWLRDRDTRISVLGWSLLFLFLVKSSLAFITQWTLHNYIYSILAKLRSRLILHYLSQPYEYHLTHDNAEAVQSVIIRAERICVYALRSGLRCFADLSVISALLLIGMLTEPIFLLSAATIGACVVLAYQRIVRVVVQKSGHESNLLYESMSQIAHNSVDGYREIRLFQKEAVFTSLMLSKARLFASAMSRLAAASIFPRQMAEMTFIAGFVSLVLISQGQDTDFDKLIPLLSVVAAAGIRVVPAVASISNSLTEIKFSRDSIEHLYGVFTSASPNSLMDENPSTNNHFEGLALEDVSYRYPNSEIDALSNISLELAPGSIIGIVGTSGSGKSTLLNLLLGFLRPSDGSVLHRGESIYDSPMSWQSMLAYVPQKTFVTEESILQNLTLETNPQDTDYPRLEQSLRDAELEQVIQQLPDGLNTRLGDSGQRLSGGQLQRLALARAFYSNREVLVLDEATSALDPDTEEMILSNIAQSSTKRTIIMVAHRHQTLKYCDAIFRVEDGRLSLIGNYQDLASIEIPQKKT